MDSMKPLDLFIRTYVHPNMKAVGFTKKGRLFRRYSPDGDALFLEFTTHQVDARATVFDVTFYIASLRYWEWLVHNEPEPGSLDRSAAVLMCPIMPPAELSYRPTGWGDFPERPKGWSDFPERWVFGDDQSYLGCGNALSGLLTMDAIRKVERLLDRKALLQEFLAPTPPNSRVAARDTGGILLSLGVVPREEMQNKLDALRGNDLAKRAVEWAESYLR